MNYNLLYKITQNTVGAFPAIGDHIYDLAYKIAKGTAGVSPVIGDSLYDLFYKIAGNTAGVPPVNGESLNSLLYKIAENTEGLHPAIGDGIPNLLFKIYQNTETGQNVPLLLTDNLVAYWKLNEVSGTVGNAASFSSSYLSCADNPAVSAGDIDFTFTCWVKATTLTGFPVVASKGWDGSSGANAEWAIYYNTDLMAFNVSGSGHTEAVNASNAGSLNLNTWYFIAVWHDSVNKFIGIQINNFTSNTQAHYYGVNDGTSPFCLGNAPSFPLYWNGLIDEAGFWKRVLTPEERTKLYNGGVGLTYPFS
jgi:hypothetical protein